MPRVIWKGAITFGLLQVLNTLRWAGEIRPVTELKLPAEGKTAAGPKPGELKMAAQLISDMTGQVHALHRCSRLPLHPSALKDCAMNSRILFSLTSLALVSGCGGGGGYSAPEPAPALATVSSVGVGTAIIGQTVLVTLQGSNLDRGLTLSSAGCSGFALSATAPNVSSATTAYFTCKAANSGAQTLSVVRTSDSTALTTASYTVQAASVASVAVSTARYSQTALFTVQGAALDLGLSVSSAGCKGAPVLSTAAPDVSTATTAFYNCTIGSVGAQTLSVVRTSDNATINSAAYTVEVPQVTLTTSNGAGVNGFIVITLEPVKAPITTDNFLAYIKNGFYLNTAYHRVLSGFVAQGGGYAAPITATATPALKPTLSSIVLEDGVGLTNAKYTLAMARTNAVDSATSQFFINLVDNNVTAVGRINLDKTPTARGYAVFGTVTWGMGVVDAMARAACTAATTGYSECVPVPNIVITAASQTR